MPQFTEGLAPFCIIRSLDHFKFHQRGSGNFPWGKWNLSPLQRQSLFFMKKRCFARLFFNVAIETFGSHFFTDSGYPASSQHQKTEQASKNAHFPIGKWKKQKHSANTQNTHERRKVHAYGEKDRWTGYRKGAGGCRRGVEGVSKGCGFHMAICTPKKTTKFDPNPYVTQHFCSNP